jgi:hypothetical protein
MARSRYVTLLICAVRIACAVALLAFAFPAASFAAYPFEFCDDLLGDGNYKNPYEERIETERHDFTQSATTVGRGVVQIEAGYTFFYHDQDGEIETAHTGPESMFRFGLSDDIEFRLRWDYAWQAIDGQVEESGAEDLRWSFKLQITEQDECSCRPTSALEINSSVPTGGEDWTTGRVGIGLDYIYQWEVAEGTTVAGSTGFATDGFADFGLLPEDQAADKSLAMSQSAVVGFELSESSTMYVEWFGIFSHGMEDDIVVNVVNIGVDYYISNNFVLDVRAGKGLSDDADDFFSGIGGGYRF